MIIIFPVVYFAVVSGFVVRFERNMVPLMPFLALGAGWFVIRVARWLAGRFRLRWVGTGLLTAVLTLLILIVPLTATVLFDMQLAGKDHRQVAGQWLGENLEPGSRIAVEHYSIPFDHNQYDVTDVLRIDDHDLEWYKAEGYDALVVSDGVWPLLEEQAEVYASRLAARDALVSGSELVAEFVPAAPPLVAAGYPTVSVYHFAPVRIYRVQE
jgi:hypothetical protein